MTNIVKFEGIPPLEKLIIESTFAKKISESTDADIKDSVRSAVTNALYNLGQKMEDGERMILQSRIVIDLKFHFQTLTIEEIKNAMDLGSKGEFRVKPDEVLYLSPEKIYNWFKSYKNGFKKEAVKSKMELLEREDKAKEPTENEKDQIILKALSRAVEDFANFKTTGEIYDPVNDTYNKLDMLGIIPFTPERKAEIKEAAIKFLRDTKFDDKDFMRELKVMDIRAKNKVKSQAKQMALKIFFTELFEMEIELKDLIQEKLNEVINDKRK
jgi:hypothetical protein